MQLAMIGLGRMGGNMVLRLQRGGHDCFAYDRDPQRTQSFDASETRKATKASSLADAIKQMTAPRVIWIMLPAGDITEAAIKEAASHLEAGDIVIDGGNSNFKDDVRRAGELARKKIGYLDAGTSGGVWGLDRGYCMMVGGDRWAYDRCTPIFSSLAPSPTGHIYCGPAGAGHFVKMIHNGIEYGMMQAFAEGFEILEKASSTQLPEKQRYELDLPAIAQVWRQGSVVSSWLLDLLAEALTKDPRLDSFEGIVQDSGEGRWTVEAAIAEAVPAPVLAASLFARFRSRLNPAFGDKVLSALRKGFGGHQEPGKK